jgi:hypothetical protein
VAHAISFPHKPSQFMLVDIEEDVRILRIPLVIALEDPDLVDEVRTTELLLVLQEKVAGS